MVKKSPGVVGLAFVSADAAKIVIDRTKWIVLNYENENYNQLVKADTDGRKKIVFLKDKQKSDFFKIVKKARCDRIVVFSDYDWMKNKGIPILDVESETSTSVVTAKIITTHFLNSSLNSAKAYQISEQDKWKAKGKPKKEKLEAFKAEKDEKKKFSILGLSNLLHIALSRTDDSMLMTTPKEVWENGFRFALGAVQKTEWTITWSRCLKSAGTSGEDLKNILKWVEQNGGDLKKGIGKKSDLKFVKTIKGEM